MKPARQNGAGLSYGMSILAMLIFGTNGYLVAHLSLQGSQIVLVRTLVGGLLLTAIVLLRGGFDREAVRAEWRDLLFGGVALGLNWVALFTAYRLLNVSLATLIYYAGPMLVLLFSPLLFRESLTPQKIAAVAIVAAGLFCITGLELGGGALELSQGLDLVGFKGLGAHVDGFHSGAHVLGGSDSSGECERRDGDK